MKRSQNLLKSIFALMDLKGYATEASHALNENILIENKRKMFLPCLSSAFLFPLHVNQTHIDILIKSVKNKTSSLFIYINRIAMFDLALFHTCMQGVFILAPILNVKVSALLV